MEIIKRESVVCYYFNMGIMSKLGEGVSSVLNIIANGIDKLQYSREYAQIEKLESARKEHAPELPIKFGVDRKYGSVAFWIDGASDPTKNCHTKLMSKEFMAPLRIHYG